jgi:AraC family transcriptional regulator of adaptative response/methylated-DNA-[protein]-cysteine methyltransferase
METASIDYRVRTCSLGRLLVAGTGRGVCYVRFGERDAELRRHLEGEFPYGEFREVANGQVRRWSDTVARYVDGESEEVDVPLDVRGSAFQRRVWAALRRIPRGQTRAYSDIAHSLGSPKGARAVARACATNPVAVVTPCHRVVERSGGLGGYAYGLARKRALLRTEGVELEPTSPASLPRACRAERVAAPNGAECAPS